MNTFLKICAFVLLAIGFALIIILTGYSIDLTQGQSLLKFLPYWIASIGFIFGGIGILNNIGYFKP